MSLIKNLWTCQKSKILLAIFSMVYLLMTSFLIGLRIEHVLIIGVYNILFFVHPNTRKFILAFTVFVIFGILYDLMKVYPNYLINFVDISSIYHFEQKVFGFTFNNQFLTPNEFFAQYHQTFLDIITGVFYINWMPVPLVFAVWLYFRNKQLFLQFSLTFLFVNLIGFSIYYIHPAAPPWYVSLYGFDLHMNVPGNTAGLARFDDLLHIQAFHSIYSRNSNVFAAMPSLHSAYPVVVLYYAIKSKIGWVKWLLGLFMIGIWFSAIYSGHHYVTDVISGILCAITGIWIFQRIILKIKIFQNFMIKYEEGIR
jgi:membrane-associated phospholipid phosphatase